MKRLFGRGLLVTAILISLCFMILSCVPGGGAGVSGSIGMGSNPIGIVGAAGGFSVEGITMSFLDSNDVEVYTNVTDENGNFIIANEALPAGTYTVVPSKTRYSFEPEYREVTIVDPTDLLGLGLDFTATAIPYIQGRVVDAQGNGVFGVRVQASGQGVAVSPSGGITVSIGDGVTVVVGGDADGDGVSFSVTDINGNFSFYNLPSDERVFTVTPAIEEFGFTPQMIDELSDPMLLDFEITGDPLEIPMKMLASDLKENHYGSSVSVADDGKTFVIGANTYDGNVDSNMEVGAIYVYRFVNGKWKQTKIHYTGVNKNTAQFGGSVSISAQGDVVMATAARIGEVFIYRWDGTEWTKTSRISVPCHVSDMSKDGLTVATGSKLDDGGEGVVNIFRYDGTQWNQTRFLPSNGFGLGETISVSGDGNTVVSNRKSFTVIYQWDGEAWTETEFFGGGGIISTDGNHIFSWNSHLEWDGSQWVQAVPPPYGARAVNMDGTVVAGAEMLGGGANISKPIISAWDGTQWNTILEIEPTAYGNYNALGFGDMSLTPDASVILIGSALDKYALCTSPAGGYAGSAYRFKLD